MRRNSNHCMRMASTFLKKWAGLTRAANIAKLFLPIKRGGLGLPSFTNLYRKLQLSRQTQLLTSRDTSVRHIATQHLQAEAQKQRQKFSPAVMVEQMRSENPGRSRHALTKAVKSVVTRKEEEALLEHLHSLPQQGEMARQYEGNSAGLWAMCVSQLPPEPRSSPSMRYSRPSQPTATSTNGERKTATNAPSALANRHCYTY